MSACFGKEAFPGAKPKRAKRQHSQLQVKISSQGGWRHKQNDIQLTVDYKLNTKFSDQNADRLIPRDSCLYFIDIAQYGNLILI